MLELMLELIVEAWSWIKKIWLKIVNWLINILSWFKDPYRYEELRRNKDKYAVAIKEKLESGDYKTVLCLFDEEKEEITDAEAITSEQLDHDTRRNFGNEDMIILEMRT